MKFVMKAGVMAAAGALLLLGGAGAAVADDGAPDAAASGYVHNSPGVLSGNLIQVPIHVPVNVCGNSLNVLAALNPTGGNTCVNE
ncbi:chaplin [Streptomyces sp. NPDC050418]|uniref:chaplin n=1 Tax=Streptomyces sp. NPDC050418 TaxID=3365612 RepID=UPI0037A8678A